MNLACNETLWFSEKGSQATTHQLQWTAPECCEFPSDSAVQVFVTAAHGKFYAFEQQQVKLAGTFDACNCPLGMLLKSCQVLDRAEQLTHIEYFSLRQVRSGLEIYTFNLIARQSMHQLHRSLTYCNVNLSCNNTAYLVGSLCDRRECI
jgi:hypothetical protein